MIWSGGGGGDRQRHRPHRPGLGAQPGGADGLLQHRQVDIREIAIEQRRHPFDRRRQQMREIMGHWVPARVVGGNVGRRLAEPRRQCRAAQQSLATIAMERAGAAAKAPVVATRSLRLKLEADPARPALLTNEPGIGDRLRAD